MILEPSKDLDLSQGIPFFFKGEVPKLFDLNEVDYSRLMHFSRKVALAIRQAIPCKRIAMTVVGLDVPHAHIHLIPLDVLDDIRFQKKVELSSEEMKKTAESITSFLVL